jgi:uncharacterized protein with ATP-grasp and redox domains
MPEIFKRTLQVVSPTLYQFVRRRYRANLHYNRLVIRIGRRVHWTVDCGPFAGMKYQRSACCERVLPKLLGSYEQELWPVLRRLAALPISNVIDVGSGHSDFFLVADFANSSITVSGSVTNTSPWSGS